MSRSLVQSQCHANKDSMHVGGLLACGWIAFGLKAILLAVVSLMYSFFSFLYYIKLLSVAVLVLNSRANLANQHCFNLSLDRSITASQIL